MVKAKTKSSRRGEVEVSAGVEDNFIRIRGARVHNLKGIDVDIPRDQFTVITGVSGSGKSSLAFDTLFAEGQRQYIDSLSAYARQFLDQIPRPDVDSIDGLAPTLAIDQKPGSASARSTVGTITEIYDYLRLLYARIGLPHCISCGSTISQQSSDIIRDTLLALPADTKLMIMAPMVRGRKGSHRDILDSIRVAGLVRVRVDGEIHAIEDVPALAPRRNHTIEAVVDRLVIREGIESRLFESLSLALRLSDGKCSTLVLGEDGEWAESLYNTLMACADCGTSFDEIEPRTFSFNSPYGACPKCDGLGHIETKSKVTICPECSGGRLRPEALKVTINGMSIRQLVEMPLQQAASFLSKIEPVLGEIQKKVAQPICREVIRRLEFLERVGVSYLTLDRRADTLSGGELQRVRLATSIGSGLVGVCYVLDEPSIGLHPADHDRLIECIRDLQRQGNTVVVVEHDAATMMAADRLIDIGPGAGSDGGELVSQGTPQQVVKDKNSLTGQYLSGEKRVSIPDERRGEPEHWLTITDVCTNNLQKVTVKFPLQRLVGISGVSGSGKSSLVNDTLFPAVAKHLGLVAPPQGTFGKLKGADHVDKLIVIDQAPIGRSARSCPATYSGVLDEVRKVFAATREAKTRGFSTSRFSFNSKDGRCELCQGHGVERIKMNFLSDLFVTCTRCGGQRFNRQTLQVRFKDANIADVLDMTVSQAADFFQNVPRVERLLRSLEMVGLGYIHLGQSSTTLSGGEAQRIKLGTELARSSTGQTLYILDEPTTGLHFADVERLVVVLQRLVDAGNTVIVIEHNFDLLAACDWIVDIGPAGGDHGGEIIGAGPPEAIATLQTSTGKFLQHVLDV